MNWKKFLLVLALLVLPLTAQAKMPHHVDVDAQLLPVLPPLYTKYDVYVGGIHLVEARIWFEEEKGAYRSVVRANTYGIWGKFFPWNTVLDSYGKIKTDHFVPREFYTRDEWNHKPKITKLHFDKTGNVTPEFDPPSHDENREIVTDEQKIGSLDPVTALLQMLAHVAVDKSCAIPVPVFDGKRRFDITGRDEGFDDNESEDYGVYSGKARLCGADFRMISGEWKDGEHARFWKKTESEPGREPFHIWLASIAPDLPEIPVRLESGSIAGLVVVHLSEWHYASDAEIKAQLP
jgi:hypothetical protein